MTSDDSEVGKLLEHLRDFPTIEAKDNILEPIFKYLVGVPRSVSDNVYHWFCDRAKPLAIEAATFLIRLFAYNSIRVDEWKKRFEVCLTGCCNCVKALQKAKVDSRTTYFGAFSEDVLSRFFAGFDEWELSIVLAALSRSGIPSDTNDIKHGLTLADIAPAVSYHMVSNLAILRDPRIMSIIKTYLPPEPLQAWPSNPPSPGLILLMVNQDDKLRQWAHDQAYRCTEFPIPKEQFTPAHVTVLEDVVTLLVSIRDTTSPSSIVTLPNEQEPVRPCKSWSFTTDPIDVWAGFCLILRIVPPEFLLRRAQSNMDLRRIVFGHLHDTGPQFISILRCLLFLLKRLRSNVWDGEGPEFPQVVFDAVKDNATFLTLLGGTLAETEKPWYLGWFYEYVKTITDEAAFHAVLAKMIDFMCEELQHERFRSIGPIMMTTAVNLLHSFLQNVEVDKSGPFVTATLRVLDIHTEVFVAVAFSKSYNDPAWSTTRRAARELVSTVLVADVQGAVASITQLCKLLAKGGGIQLKKYTTHKQLWEKTYCSIQTSDLDAMQLLVSIVARTAHLDLLIKKVFKKALAASVEEGSESPEAVFNEVNNISLVVIREGLLDILPKFANYNTSSTVLDFLRRPGVVKDLIALMFSPIDNLQMVAQTLVGQAFDVDGRLDCFRALLENFPDAGLDSIFSFIETYIKYAPAVPEACSLSKSLVRCLTDVIEVLCANPDGLLHNAHYLRLADKSGPSVKLPRLWTLMSKAITVIFKRAPYWAPFFENEDMIVWMRDALIFARDMFAQRGVIETAADAPFPGKAGQLSDIGVHMMNDLQPVLLELARWLRLTDEELLHQSFSLLQTLLDCFRESQIPPSEYSLNKLSGHLKEARRDASRTRLDPNRLSKLDEALASFIGDDEVEIISHVIPDSKAIATERNISDTTKEIKKSIQKPVTIQDHKLGTRKPPEPSTLIEKDKRKADEDAIKTTLSKARASAPLPRAADTTRWPSKTSSAASSDEESESEEESQAGLASLQKLQKSPKRVQKQVERRQVKMMDLEMVQKNAMQERLRRRDEEIRTALRLKPDISGLHRALLSWSYDGSEPPLLNNNFLRSVPDKFTDHNEYRKVFEPLLLLECWSQIVQSRDERPDIFDCKVTSRQFSSDWLDLEVFISESVKKDWYLTETDVVLLRHLDGSKCILGKTLSYRPSPRGIQATIRCLLPGGSNDPGLQINSTWRLHKVFSLSTIHREYAALMSMPYYDLYNTILQSRLSRPPHILQHDIRKTMAAYSVNEPQAVAILSSLQTDGFALIQGPPGTGKTSTICGLVESFLESRPRPSTAIHVGRTSTSVDKNPPKKVLLCAPSNAAIDEVAHRIKEGFRGPERRGTPPRIVRVGTDKAINISVKDVSLDYLVDQRLNATAPDSTIDTSNALTALRGELDSVKRLKFQKQTELGSLRDNTARKTALEDEIKKLNSKRMTLSHQFDMLKDKRKSDSRTLDANRRKFRVEILTEADIICSTLSGAGHEILEQFDFEMVVIDEAAQAIELSSLIPLKYRCKRCIMVGDPQQLPPTVISQEACKFQYNQSLFVRLQKQRPDAVHLLSIQYRMHPQISLLPSRIFYQERLKDGPDMELKTKQPWHTHDKFGIYKFFNITRGLESQSGHSLKNSVECQVAVALYARLRQEFSGVNFDFRVGVVSMYRAQIQELRRLFEQRFGSDIIGRVDFNTVDGFQGQEKDVIILSCVRAGPGLQSVGFLSDTRRMNVALTRARSSLFILGHAATLERSDETWRKIVQDSRSRTFLTEVDVAYFTSPSTITSRVPAPTKAVKPPSTTPAIPEGLSTPRELKEAADRKHTTSIPKPTSDQRDDTASVQNGLPEESSEVKVLPVPQPAINDEQMVAENNVPAPPQRPLAEHSHPKARNPPAKRAKQAPTLFIPKSNKRPAPDGESGPSNRRKF